MFAASHIQGERGRDVFSHGLGISMAVVRHNEARPSMVVIRWKMESKYKMNYVLTSNKFSELYEVSNQNTTQK